MILTVLGAIMPVLLSALVGYVWTRSGRTIDPVPLAPLITEVGTPCLIFATFAKTSISPDAIGQTALTALVIMVGFMLCSAAVLRFMKLSLRTYLPSMSFPNAGNLGLPLSLYAFGQEGLSYAIVFFTLTTLINFTIGQAISARSVAWRTFAKMPLIYAVILGVAVSVLQVPVPGWLLNTVSLLGSFSIPLMLLLLGISLGRMRVADFPRALMLSVLRIGAGGLVALGVTTALGLHGLPKQVLIQQAAMPVAVYNYLFALRWNNSPEEIAGIVVVSTALAIITAPTILYFLL